MSLPAPEPLTAELLNKLHRAADFQRRGELSLARQLYQDVLETRPSQFDALHMLGVLELMSGKLAEGLALVDRAISVNSQDAMAYRNRSVALRQSGRLEASLLDVERALAINGRWPELHCERGDLLLQLRRPENALSSFQNAIDQSPGLAEAYLGRGNALCEIGLWREALASYEHAITLRRNYADAFGNKAVAHYELEEFEAAIESWGRALELAPDNQTLRAQLCFARLRTCAWQDLDADITLLLASVARKEAICDPFQLLAMTDSPALQRAGAERWVQAKCPSETSLGPIAVREKHERIRIGYFSADFHDHATSRLIAELIETHDRDNFELHGFSFGPDSSDSMRRRIAAAFDQFLDVRTMSDREVAQRARDIGIDIAVDLKGHTRGSRGGIFALRAAPLQVSYLGFPGTFGAAYMDYLVADRIVVPERLQAHYWEKLIYLPDSYQANDTHREISDRRFSRDELGLPDQGFVFCCFNNNFKITPEVFGTWMRVLRRVPGSVLWLLGDNPWVSSNLRSEASARGIDPRRLIFADRMLLPSHLARHRAADLFLDTAPCGAHTTASDALWAGLPVLTQTGESFASRVAASLLTALQLPELITENAVSFEAAATSLAMNPDELDVLKMRLAVNRQNGPLFHTERFARHLEASFHEIHERYRHGLPPANVFVQRDRNPAAQGP